MSDDPNLEKFGLRMSVFTIKYFGISMRAAHLKAAVKEQMCRKLAKDQQKVFLFFVFFCFLFFVFCFLFLFFVFCFF